MKMTKLGKALFVALSAMSPKIAADSAIPAMLSKATRKDLDVKALKGAIVAVDADFDMNNVDDVVEGFTDDPMPQQPAVEQTPVDKIKMLLAGKVDDDIVAQIIALIAPAEALDADMVDKEEMKAAMDEMRKDFVQVQEALVAVRPVVGDLIGMDSAVKVYGFALDQLKVDREGVDTVAGLKALFKVANKAPVEVKPIHVAQDSAGLAAKFPNAMRFKTI